MNTRIKQIIKIRKNFFSTLNGNFIKYTSNLNQIKIPINNHCGVIYFNNEETMSSLKIRLNQLMKNSFNQL